MRNLAHRSASAAKDIKQLITDSVVQISTGSALVSEAEATMQGIVISVQSVKQIIGAIASTGGEPEIGIEQINIAVAEMDTVTKQNAALVEEAAAASQAMEDQAVALAETVSIFRLGDINDSLAASRSALKPKEIH